MSEPVTLKLTDEQVKEEREKRKQEAKEKGIGPADAAAVMGASRYECRMGIYREKIGQEVKKEEKPASKIKERLIQPIVEMFTDETGLAVMREEKIAWHETYPFMVGVAEFWTEVDGKAVIVQPVNASAYSRRDWEGAGVPLYYEIKMQHNLNVFGLDFGYYAVLIGGNHFIVKKVERNQEFIDTLVQELRRFWWRVENEIAPEIDGSMASTEYLKELYPFAEENTEERFPAEYHEDLEKLLKIEETIKQLEYDKTEIQNRMKHFMGSVEKAWIGNTPITWKNQTQKRVDQKKLQEKYPDVYKECLKETKFRVFKIGKAR